MLLLLMISRCISLSIFQIILMYDCILIQWVLNFRQVLMHQDLSSLAMILKDELWCIQKQESLFSPAWHGSMEVPWIIYFTQVFFQLNVCHIACQDLVFYVLFFFLLFYKVIFFLKFLEGVRLCNPWTQTCHIGGWEPYPVGWCIAFFYFLLPSGLPEIMTCLL